MQKSMIPNSKVGDYLMHQRIWQYSFRNLSRMDREYFLRNMIPKMDGYFPVLFSSFFFIHSFRLFFLLEILPSKYAINSKDAFYYFWFLTILRRLLFLLQSWILLFSFRLLFNFMLLFVFLNLLPSMIVLLVNRLI